MKQTTIFTKTTNKESKHNKRQDIDNNQTIEENIQ